MITLGGKPCSGKSTIGKNLEKDYGFDRISIGDWFREIAKEKGLTVNELNDYLTKTKDPEIDYMLDKRVVELHRRRVDEDVVIESRTAAFFAPRAYNVFTDINKKEQIKRIVNSGRTGEDINPETALESLLKRENDESERYVQLYKYDNRILSNYDLVLDTSNITPQQGAQKVIDGYYAYKDAKKNQPVTEEQEFEFTFIKK